MLHSIQADFYRLLRSKGFWILEAFMLLNILIGIIFGIPFHLGVSTSNPEQALNFSGNWNGIESMSKVSQNGMILFPVVVLLFLLIGTDISKKLYKNAIPYGISRTSFYVTKFATLFSLTIFQFIQTYGVSFICASILNGVGLVPKSFFVHFSLTILVQLIGVLAWISLLSFVLYLTHSIIATILSFIVFNSIFSLPLIFFPDIELLKYLNLNFSFEMSTHNDVIIQTTILAICTIIIFNYLNVIVFKKKDLG